MSRVLIYHAERDSLFEVTQSEYDRMKTKGDNCEIVTDHPVYEKMYLDRQQFKGGSMARDEKKRSSMRDRVRQRTEETEHGGGGTKFDLPEKVKFFSAKKGTSELDIIPYEISDPRHPEVLSGRSKVGDLIDSRTIWVHGFVGAEEKAYVCLKSVGKACPLCEAQIALSKNTNADPEEAKNLKAKERQVFNVIDLGEKNGPVQLWEFSYHLFGKKLEEEQRENEDYYGFAELEGGYTLRIRFGEKSIGRGKPFLEATRIDFTKRDAYEESILDEVVDIDKALKVLSYEQLDKIYNGVPDVEEDDKEEQPRGRSSRDKDEEQEEKPSRRRKEAEPEEEERPSRKRATPEPEEKTSRRRATTPEPEEEEEDEIPSKAARTSRRGAEPEETIHEKDPDVEVKKKGRHEVDPDQDCPGGGKFGVDTDKLDGKNGCDNCDNWDACRDEKDAKARAAKPAAGKRGK
jgi:hypothetical protein